MNLRPFFFFPLILFSTLCSAQDWTWEPANGPYGGPVLSLVMDRSGRFFAGTETKGVFLSTDQGESWQQSGLTSNRINALAVDSLGAIVAATSNNLYRSTDAGVQWKSILVPGMSPLPNALTVSPEGWIMLCSQSTLHWSNNSGTNWTIWGMSSIDVRAIACTPAGTWIVAAGDNLLRSTNKGSSWTKSDSSFTGTSLYLSPSGRFYAGSDMEGIYSSTDDGVTWARVASGNGHTVKAITGMANDELFAALSPLDPSISGGIIRSTDNGATWGSWGLRHLSAYTMIPDGRSGIMVGTYYGLFHSPAADSVWDEINNGLTNVTVKVLKTPSSAEVLAGTNIGMFYSSDHGARWVNAVPGLVPGDVNAVATHKFGRLFFSTMLFSPLGGVYRSEDNGAHWSQVSDTTITGMYESIPGLLIAPDDHLYVGTSGGRVFRSSDLGDTWVRVDSAKSCGTIKALVADSTGRIFVGSGKGVFRSTNDGETWVERNSGITNTSMRCIAAKDSTWLFAGGSGGVYRSSNAAEVWSKLDPGVMGAVNALSITPSGDILATIAGQVHKSTDNGDTWMQYTTGLPGAQIWALAVSSDATVYAGTDTNAVFFSHDVALAVPYGAVEIPSRVTLHQNYPNPFNPSTTIRFAVPARTNVQLTVWNMLGQRVAVLQDGELDAGQHETILDARGLASGVYFYRIQAGSFTKTKRLLLLR
jgi:photosystem II stability/assembly factor-like uncharacterized protein